MKSKTPNIYHKLPILDGLELLDAKHHTLNFPFHTHQTFNITLVLEQTFSTKLFDRLLHSTAGSIVITNPEEVHATFCDNKTGSSFFTFYVSPDVLSKLNKEKAVYFDDKVLHDKFLFQQFHRLSQNINHSAGNSEKDILRVLTNLVERHATENPDMDKRSTLFREFLEEDNLEKFSLSTTAGKFGLNKFKFLRLFKQYTGLTPNNYLILKRVEKSKLLLQTQDDLLSIAVESGFYDATHFCKHFKRITGVTPMAYRNAMLCNIIP